MRPRTRRPFAAEFYTTSKLIADTGKRVSVRVEGDAAYRMLVLTSRMRADSANERTPLAAEPRLVITLDAAGEWEAAGLLPYQLDEAA